jgi:preprotein translocase subunit SecE
VEKVMINPIDFVQQVKREISKVIWPTRKEVTITTIMVFILVMLAAGFFLLADQVLIRMVKLILGLGA